jgi:hypothetical protein
MDLFDLLSLFPVYLPGGSSQRRKPEENVTGLVALTVLPVVDFVVVLFAKLYAHPLVAMVVLPGAMALAALVLCRALRTSTPWTAATTVACAALCFIASGAAFLLGVLASFYSAF